MAQVQSTSQVIYHPIHHDIDYQKATRKEFAEECEYWKQRALASEEKAADLACELVWMQGIIANPAMQGSTQTVLIGTHLAIKKSQAQGFPRRNNLIRVYREDVARFAGCSPQTVSDQQKKLFENGLLAREVISIAHDDKFDKALYVGLPEIVMDHPEQAEITTAKQGGARIPTCSSCGGANILKQLRFVCGDCGSVMKQNELIMVSSELLAMEQEQQEAQAQLDADELAAIPSVDKPRRPCIVCSYEQQKEVYAWVWDIEQQKWICGNSHESERGV